MTTDVVNLSETEERALAAIERELDRYRPGRAPDGDRRYRRTYRFPWLAVEDLTRALQDGLGCSATRARATYAALRDRGLLIRKGTSTATRYTTREVAHAELADLRAQHRQVRATYERLAAALPDLDLDPYDKRPWLGERHSHVLAAEPEYFVLRFEVDHTVVGRLLDALDAARAEQPAVAAVP